MCWIFHDTLPIWLSIRCPLKKIVFASWKVFKVCLRAPKRWLWSFRSAIFRENNHSSMTSQPSLRLGIFRTDERIFQLLIIYIVHPRLVFRFRENRSKRCRTISISKHQTRVCLRRLDDRKRIKLATKIAKIMPSSY